MDNRLKKNLTAGRENRSATADKSRAAPEIGRAHV